MAKYGYMVDTRGPKPDLVRYSDDGFERYTPNEETKWSKSKFLDAFAWGGSDFVWFDDISPVRAEEYMREIEAFWEKRKAEDNEFQEAVKTADICDLNEHEWNLVVQFAAEKKEESARKQGPAFYKAYLSTVKQMDENEKKGIKCTYDVGYDL